MLAKRLWDPPAFLPQPKMTFDQILSAVYAMPRAERDRLYHAIVFIDGWCKADECDSVPKRHANNRKAYTGEELVALHEIASRIDTDCSFGEKQQREAIQQAAKRLGRTEKAIAEKIRTIRLS